MKIKPLYIIIAVALLLIFWATCERSVEDKQTVKENTRIEQREETVKENNADIKQSQYIDSLLVACREQAEAEYQIKLKKHEENFKQRQARVRVPATAPTPKRVAQLRELSDFFQTDEWERAVNNRTK